MTKFENIYIDAEDDVSAVVERILDSRSDNVIIFVPNQSKMAESVLNFRLLYREAKNSDKKVYINSDSEVVMEMAQKAGLPVLEERIKEGEEEKPVRKSTSFIRDIAPPKKSGVVKENKKDFNQNDYRDQQDKKIEAIFKERIARKADALESQLKSKIKSKNFIDEEIAEKDLVKVKEQRKHFKIKLPKKFVLISLGVVLFLILICGILYFFGSAKVNLVTIKTDWQEQVAVLASKSLEQSDFSNLKITAEYLKLSRDASQEFSATGIKDVEIKSQGKITIYNSYSSTAQTLIANTRFLSESGKIFRITSAITVPGAKIESGTVVPSSITVNVVADQAGEEYNIGPTKFTIPGFKGTAKYDKFYAQSTENMTGGHVGQAKVVSASDLSNAKASLSDVAKVSLEEEFSTKFPQGYKILEEAKVFSIDKATFSAKEGDAVETFKLDLSASLKILAFSEDDIKEIFLLNAQKSLENYDDKELFSANFEYGVPRVDFEKGLISFPVTGNLVFRDKMDLDFIKSQLTTINEKKLRQFFSELSGIEDLQIKIKPSLFDFFPVNPNNLTISIDG